MTEEQSNAKFRQWVLAVSASSDFRACAAAITTVVIGIILVVIIQKGFAINDSATTVAVLLVPLLVYGIASGRLRELTGPGGWGAKFVEIERVKSEVKQTKSQIESLYALSMSEDAFRQLKRLSTNSYGRFWLDPDLRVGLAHELMYFKVLGYIEFNEKLVKDKDERNLPKGDHPDDDLSHYISVTPQGRAFIALREQAVEQALKNA